MTIEVIDESDHALDVKGLSTLSRFVMDKMRVHPQAERERGNGDSGRRPRRA